MSAMLQQVSSWVQSSEHNSNLQAAQQCVQYIWSDVSSSSLRYTTLPVAPRNPYQRKHAVHLVGAKGGNRTRL